MHRLAAFTLIELLVVITIIIVLLALLTPALDRAVYQAQLAACGANLHGLGAGVQTYAIQNKRYYPARPGVTTPDKNWQAAMLQNGGVPAYEERRFLKGYVSLNGQLNDPLTGRIDIENGGKAGVGGQSVVTAGFVYSAYTRWYTWGYKSPGPEAKTLLKIGDRFSWGDESFDLLASDWATSLTDGSRQGWGSHPDDLNAWTNVALQDQSLSTTNAYKYTLTRWLGAGRGKLDLNCLDQDGSVRRFDGVKRNDGSAGEKDERMSTVPDYNDGTAPTWWDLIPLN